jgi:hypothetical protein
MQQRYNFRRNQVPLSANNASNVAAVKKAAKAKPVEPVCQPTTLASSLESTLSQLIATKSYASALKIACMATCLSESHLITVSSLYFDLNRYRPCLHHILLHKLHLSSIQALILAAKCHVSLFNCVKCR